jgi:parallel beta-helix repeat protein
MTANLQAFVDSVPDGSTIVFPAGSVYRIDGMLVFRNRKGLTFEGNGAVLRRYDPGLSGTDGALFTREVRFMSGGNLTIRNLTIMGANPNAGMSNAAWDPAYEFQHGIELDGVQGALLDHVRIHDVYGDFVYLGMSQSEGVQTPSRNVTIQDSRFERNGRMGISVDYAENTLIQNNYMGDCRRSWVDVEPTGATWQVRGLTIRNNTVGPHRLNFFANAGRGDNVGDVVISGNRTAPGVAFGAITISRGDSSLAQGGYRGPYLIEGNVGPTRAGFSFRESAGITIQNNDMSFPKDVVVQLNDAHTIQVHDNNFSGATGIFRVNDPTPGLTYDYSQWRNKL